MGLPPVSTLLLQHKAIRSQSSTDPQTSIGGVRCIPTGNNHLTNFCRNQRLARQNAVKWPPGERSETRKYNKTEIPSGPDFYTQGVKKTDRFIPGPNNKPADLPKRRI